MQFYHTNSFTNSSNHKKTKKERNDFKEIEYFFMNFGRGHRVQPAVEIHCLQQMKWSEVFAQRHPPSIDTVSNMTTQIKTLCLNLQWNKFRSLQWCCLQMKWEWRICSTTLIWVISRWPVGKCKYEFRFRERDCSHFSPFLLFLPSRVCRNVTLPTSTSNFLYNWNN